MPRVKIGPALPDRATVAVEMARLRDLDIGELRNRWHAVFGRRPPVHLPRHLLFRVLAYRLQADHFGDLDSEYQRLLDRSEFPEEAGQSIMLEELGVPYTVTPIDIGKDEQFAPEFLKISPNNKIPAIVDRETGTHLMESGAILMYLAEKHGRFMPSGQAKWPVIEWQMWQMGGIGPFLGRTSHFGNR